MISKAVCVKLSEVNPFVLSEKMINPSRISI